MAEGLTLSRLYQAYAAASPARKLLWWAAILLLLAVPPALLWRDGQQPDYRVLFAKLSDKDGGEVVEALERLRIEYRIAESSGAIEVPSDQLHVARYKLAAQGLPRGDKPAESETAGPRFGISPFQEQLGYQHGLEAELARSVETIAAVESARVHLALPKQSAFLREPVPPAATVLVKLKSGMQLSKEQVEAIRQIVVGSVSGMAAAQVSVVDQTGTLLEGSEAAPLIEGESEAEAQPAPSAPVVEATPPVVTPPTIAPVTPAKPARAQPAMPEFDTERMPVYAGIAVALIAAILLLRMRTRHRRQREQEEAQAQMEAQQGGEKFDARLDTLRQAVLADPKITASVVKLWMQNP